MSGTAARTPTLIGRLLGWQILLTGVACVSLVVGTMAVAGLLLRSHQDHVLRDVSRAVCSGVLTELAERHSGGDLGAAAHEFLDEMAPGQRVDVSDAPSGFHVSSGGPEGLPSVRAGRYADACGSVRHSGRIFRSCEQRCEDRFTVRVAEEDSLHTPVVRGAATSLLGVLPIAVLIGALTSRAVFARLLRPLREITRAAATLEPAPGLRVNVPAPTEEMERLEGALNDLLSRLDAAVARERRFAQQAPHELRTPLTAVRIRLEGLRCSAGLRDARAQVDLALEELDALDRLIDALLLLAGAEDADFPTAPVNLCDLARESATLGLADDAAPPPIVEAPDEILVAGNHDLLERALANLVDNARKYAGPSPRLRIRAFTDNGHGVLSVEDDGPGIPSEIRPFVFERFYRGAADRHRIRGSGLGLSVVDAIVRRHRGQVEARRSTLGGQDMRIRFPLLDARPTPVAARAPTGTR